jgi:hypothetical protein
MEFGCDFTCISTNFVGALEVVSSVAMSEWKEAEVGLKISYSGRFRFLSKGRLAGVNFLADKVDGGWSTGGTLVGGFFKRLWSGSPPQSRYQKT